MKRRRLSLPKTLAVTAVLTACGPNNPNPTPVADGGTDPCEPGCVLVVGPDGSSFRPDGGFQCECAV